MTEWDFEREAQENELARIAAMQELALEDAARREFDQTIANMANVIEQAPRGKKLLPKVAEALKERVEQATTAGETLDVADATAELYKQEFARVDVEKDARFHAEQQQPFRSTQGAEGWRLVPPGDSYAAERFPTVESLAAQQAARLDARERELLAAHEQSAIKARVAGPKTTEQLTQEALEMAQRANDRRWLVENGLVNTGPAPSASKVAVARIEGGRERDSTFREASEQADAAARAIDIDD